MCRVFSLKRDVIEGESGQGESRTPDTAIFSRMLYQLSYLPAVREPS